MKKLNFNAIYLLIVSVLLVTACQDDEFIIDETDVDNNPTESYESNPILFRMTSQNSSSLMTSDGVMLNCLILPYPFDLVLNGDTINVADESDMSDVVMTIDTSESFAIDFVYPINYIDVNGVEHTATSSYELSEEALNCIPDVWSSQIQAFLPDSPSCLYLTYPITVVDSLGQMYSATNDSEYLDLLATSSPLYFTFPMDVVTMSGETVTLNNEQEMFTLLTTCNNPGPGGDSICPTPFDDCLEFGFPISVVTNNGTMTYNSDQELYSGLAANGFVDFVYPFDLTVNDTVDLTITNFDQFTSAYESCGGITSGEFLVAHQFIYLGLNLNGDSACYQLVYPFEVIDFGSGERINIEQEQDAVNIINAGYNENLSVGFPISIRSKDGTTVHDFVDFDGYLNYIETNCR